MEDYLRAFLPLGMGVTGAVCLFAIASDLLRAVSALRKTRRELHDSQSSSVNPGKEHRIVRRFSATGSHTIIEQSGNSAAGKTKDSRAA